MAAPGQRHLVVPQLLRVAHDALAELPALLSDGGDPGRVLVVSGKGPTEAYARRALEHLASAGVTCEHLAVDGGSVDNAAALAAYCISTDADIVIAVGGGRVIDTVKYAGARVGRPFIAVPTALAHDGISSPVASLVDAAGVKRSLAATMPAGVVVDTAVIAEAPLQSLRAGLGDLVSNLLALADWRLAHASGLDHYDEFSALIAESAARPALDITDLSAPGTIDLLAKGLVMSGLAMATAGTSRPCSGAEHLISHALDSVAGGSARLHGEQVALGSLIAAAAHGQHLSQLQDLFSRTGLPTHPSGLGLDLPLVRRAVQLAPGMRPGRWTVLSSADLTDAGVDGLLDAAFGAPSQEGAGRYSLRSA